jgi:hypothetical protein
MFKNVKCLTLSLLLFVLSSSCYGMQQSAGPAAGHANIATAMATMQNMSLPINGTVDPNIHIAIQLPQNFRLLSSTLFLQRFPQMEYIPTNENANSWTEKITLKMMKGAVFGNPQQWNAINCRNLLVQSFHGELLEPNTEQTHQHYMEASFKVLYTDPQNGHQKIVFGKCFSGPYDLSLFQYTIDLANGMTIPQAMHKIKDFVDNHTHIQHIPKDAWRQ